MIETEGVFEIDIEGVIEMVALILALGVLDTEGDKDTEGVIEILGVVLEEIDGVFVTDIPGVTEIEGVIDILGVILTLGVFDGVLVGV